MDFFDKNERVRIVRHAMKRVVRPFPCLASL